MSDNCGIVTGDILGDILGDINALPMSPIGDIPGGYISPLKGGDISRKCRQEDRETFSVCETSFPAIEIRGQKFFWLRCEPYVRKDGVQSVLHTWRTSCPKCPAIFEVSCGAVFKIGNRFCRDHSRYATTQPPRACLHPQGANHDLD